MTLSNPPKTIAIIQARMGSSRLPGKVLLDIAGQPMLQRVVGRARRAASLNAVAVATTSDPADDPVADFCQREGILFTRGSLHDVLDRYYQAARQLEASTIVRLTADCPLIDPGVIDDTVRAFLGEGVSDPSSVISNQSSPITGPCDFAANRLPPPWHRTFPIGLDVEVCSFAVLERAWNEAHEPYQREHVMPYFYEQPGRFRVRVLDHIPDYGHLRWTVDTPADLELARQIYTRFGGRADFSWQEVLALFEREPELAKVNAGVAHRSAFDVDQRSVVDQRSSTGDSA